MKEEVDYDPSKTEEIKVDLKINDRIAISESMPWIIDEVEDKIQITLGMDHLNSLEVRNLNCKSWVANEFLDVLTCYDIPENGFDKLIF